MTAAAVRHSRVFVSCPAELTIEQQTARRDVVRELHDRQIETFILNRTQYETIPWQQLRHVVASADGVVVFGFGQLHVIAGEWRPGTTEARPAAEWYPTPWNQIEAGLAIMASVPVLVTGDIEVTDGVFSPDIWGDCVFGLPMHSDPPLRRRVVDRWATAVRARATGRTVTD